MYRMNSEMPWIIRSHTRNEKLPINVPIWALIEEDTHDKDEQPWTAKVQFEKTESGNPELRIRLLDYDPEEQEEILQQYYTVVAYRHITE